MVLGRYHEYALWGDMVYSFRDYCKWDRILPPKVEL